MCIHIETPNKFNAAINKVITFEIEDLKLYFFDDAGLELLRL
jgi:hypothetical protein